MRRVLANRRVAVVAMLIGIAIVQARLFAQSRADSTVRAVRGTVRAVRSTVWVVRRAVHRVHLAV